MSEKQLESEMIPPVCTLEAILVPTMTNLTPSIYSEPVRGPGVASDSPCCNGILYQNSSPKVENGPSAIKRGRRLDIELQGLFAESRAGNIWRTAAYLSPSEVHFLTEPVVGHLTDRGDRAFLSTSSRLARLQVNIHSEKQSFGPAVSSLAVCIPCWSGQSDSPRTFPPPARRSPAQVCTTSFLGSLENGPNHCITWPSGETRMISGFYYACIAAGLGIDRQ